jgi:hypothetical protein
VATDWRRWEYVSCCRILVKLVAFPIVILALQLNPIGAMPPPPFDARDVKSTKAIGALAEFLGSWRNSASEGSSGPARNLWRVGNVILFISSGDRPVLVNIISYDPARGRYRMHLAGYRSTYLSPMEELVDLNRPAPNVIRWKYPQAQFSGKGPQGYVIETVTIRNGEWHEQIGFESVGEPPSVATETILKRKGSADVNALRAAK